MGPKPPESLHQQGKSLWRFVTTNFFPEAHHLAVLRVACEALDRYAACRKRIDREGLVYKDRWGKPRPHVLLGPERDARQQFVTALTALGLDESDLPQRMAPARPGALRVLPGQKGR
jgi:P27 family predicted phage terminase small subunit